ETAIHIARRMGSRPIVARAQSLLASVQLSSPIGAVERERVAAMLAEAAQCARELEMLDVIARAERLQAKLAQPSVESNGNEFRREGEVWTVRYDGQDVRLKDGKGPRYLAALLAVPGRELHVLEFVATPTAPAPPSAQDGLSVGTLGGSLEDAPDQRARREYRARLDDLRAELEEAETFADSGRAERLRVELDQLMGQLSERFGARAARR